MFLFYQTSPEEAFKKLASSRDGLNNSQIQERLKKYGLNKLKTKKAISPFEIFLSQFKNPLILLLLAAGIISLIIKQYLDAEIVFGAILINVIIGFFQENKANNVLKELKKLVEHRVLVRRQGLTYELNSSQIVPGDIIILRAGEQISADGRIIKSIDLEVNEASLTGEFNPIFKNTKTLQKACALAERKNMLYSGTIILGGSGEILVTATGIHTELGKISTLVQEIKEKKTPLQKRLYQLSKFISLIAVSASLIIVIFGVFNGQKFFEIFLTAVAVAVAAVPEGLVVAVTVILTLGMKQILKHKALTRKLVAVEALGSITTICTDKTGTLTEGKMSLVQIISADQDFKLANNSSTKNLKNKEFPEIIRAGLLANNAILEIKDKTAEQKIIGSAIDVAILKFSQKFSLEKKELLMKEKKIAELPFNSRYKFMISLYQNHENNYTLYEKGSSEKIISKCTKILKASGIQELNNEEKEKLQKKIVELSSQGLRLIALAYKKIDTLPWSLSQEKKDWTKIDKNLIFLGLMVFKDPVRSDARETITKCQRAGIRPIIITGDHPATALAIAQEVGLSEKIDDLISGPEIDALSDKELENIVKNHNIYARVSPENKFRIVQALQNKGEIVAMTGDGLNDSPALKKADIGICLGSGTEVSKETADIILLDDNFKVIVTAIREGRIIFNNIRKSITYLISDCFSEMFLILGSIFFGTPLALLPAQILWINIINDGLPNFSLAFERSGEDVMNLPPIKKDEPIVNNEMKTIIFWLGLSRDFGILLIFIYLYRHQSIFSWDIDYLRTLFFALLGFKSISGIFSLRSLSLPITKINHRQNPYLLGAFSISLALLLLAIYWPPLQKIISTVPLGFKAWLVIIIISILNILIIELIKYFYRTKNNHKKQKQINIK